MDTPVEDRRRGALEMLEDRCAGSVARELVGPREWREGR